MMGSGLGAGKVRNVFPDWLPPKATRLNTRVPPHSEMEWSYSSIDRMARFATATATATIPTRQRVS